MGGAYSTKAQYVKFTQMLIGRREVKTTGETLVHVETKLGKYSLE
jgi:hypothetical protein